MLHEDVKKYVSFTKEEKEALIKQFSIFNEHYDESQKKDLILTESDLEPLLNKLEHKNFIPCIKDLNYLKENFPQIQTYSERIRQTYSKALDFILETDKIIVQSGELDFLEHAFATYFKRLTVGVPLIKPTFIQIGEINNSYIIGSQRKKL